MIKLDTIQIASPCHADWHTMEGDSQVRFCGGCRKNVYNLSEMTRTEAEQLVNRLEGKLCVRFYTRSDGTALTSDCPVGLRAVRYRRIRKFSYAAAVMLACTSGLLDSAEAVTVAKRHPIPAAKPAPKTRHLSVPPTMGKLAAPHVKPVNPAVGLYPFALPSAQGLPPHTMGMISAMPLRDTSRPPSGEPPPTRK